MKTFMQLCLLFCFLTLNLQPVMAQQKDFSTYPAAIRIHVKSFYKYLEKGKKDPKYWKDAEKKVNYLKGKDAAVAAELQAELTKVKGDSDSTAPAAKTVAKKETPPPTANTGKSASERNVKYFREYLAKAEKNIKYLKDAETKLKYIEGKDAALGQQLRSEYESVKTRLDAAKTKATTNKTAVSSSSKSNANDKAVDSAVKSFYKYLEQGKISNAETKLKYIEGKDATLGSELRSEFEAQKQKVSSNKNQKHAAVHIKSFNKHIATASTADNLRTRAGALERAESSLKKVEKYDPAKAAELRSLLEKEKGSLAADEQAVDDNVALYYKVNNFLKTLQSYGVDYFGGEDYDMEDPISNFKSTVDAFIGDAQLHDGLTKIKTKTAPEQAHFASTTFDAYQQKVAEADANFTQSLEKQKTEATKKGNSPRIAYQKMLSMEGFWYAASKVFPEKSQYNSHISAVKSAMAGLGGKEGVEKMVAVNDAEFLDSKRMAKAVSTDPQLSAKFKQFFQKYKKENVSDAQRIVLLTASWKMVKHELTGLPLYKWQKAQIAAKENDTGRCVLYELTLKQEFNGTGCEPIDIRSLYETMTIGCKNIHK